MMFTPERESSAADHVTRTSRCYCCTRTRTRTRIKGSMLLEAADHKRITHKDYCTCTDLLHRKRTNERNNYCTILVLVQYSYEYIPTV